MYNHINYANEAIEWTTKISNKSSINKFVKGDASCEWNGTIEQSNLNIWSIGYLLSDYLNSFSLPFSLLGFTPCLLVYLDSMFQKFSLIMNYL